MKLTRTYLIVLSLVLPAFLSFFYAQYLIENFFPEVTLIDLGAFYFLGFISGISLGLSLMLARTKRL